MEKLPFEGANETAIAVFEASHGGKKINELFEERFGDPASRIFELRGLYGLRCAQCGKNNITFPILKFYGYKANVKCYECQHATEKKADKQPA